MRHFARFVFLLAASVALLEAPPRSPAQTSGSAPPENHASSNSLAIIVNQSNPVQDLSFAELRRVFLGERSHWPNGRRITLVMMELGQPERKAVLREICRTSEEDFRKNFLQRLFTGEAIVSPKTLASPSGVRKFVFNVPGAIGYVRAGDVDGSVKVIRIDGRLPNDKDYRLQIDPHPLK
jgi:ABC-type phosphate transport system substrate-binding protein